MALLQQVATASQVSNARHSLLSPSLVTGEPLSERSEGEARLLIEQRLMDRGVDNETVQPHRHFLVSSWLQGRRRPGPCSRGRRHRLGRHKILTINMRYRSGLANVRVVAGQVFVDSGFLCPRGGHGNVVGALDLHAIANEGSALFV